MFSEQDVGDFSTYIDYEMLHGSKNNVTNKNGRKYNRRIHILINNRPNFSLMLSPIDSVDVDSFLNHFP